MLLSGITTVNDMSCHRNLGGLGSLGAADGLAELGLRGIVSFGAENLYDGAPPEELFMAEHEALADRLAGEPLLGFRLGIGTVLGVSEELMTRSVAACREHGWAVHTHLAEVREELTESRHLNAGRTTIEHSQPRRPARLRGDRRPLHLVRRGRPLAAGRRATSRSRTARSRT